jgi:glycosyltransferase involved in cell wall biosynthesis
MQTAVFTVVSANYGACALTLMESLCLTHPDWHRHVLLVDQVEDPAGFGEGLFLTTLVEDLLLPKQREFLFRYEIVELNTAVKPYMFAHLRRLGFERVVYIDPDVLVVDRLVDVERLLDEGACAVVTPHLTAPLPNDGLGPTELDILRAGSFNLGFLALSCLPAADAFIHWWQAKLEYGAVADPNNGLFTDQKWVDLAPGMFGGFAVLRDPGYNVAYWNLPHRSVTRNEGVWMAADRPLRFFHFSGFNPTNPQPLSKHQNRLTLDSIGEAGELAMTYAAKLLEHGYLKARTRPYAFGVFADGTPIPAEIRWLFRDDSALRLAAGEDPFVSSEFFTQGERGGLPTILRGIWLRHQHLQRAFPDPLGFSREAFYRWFVDAGAVEIGIPDAFVRPVSRALSKLIKAGPNAVAIDRLPANVSVWARALDFLHRRVTGRVPSMARRVSYQQVTGPIQFLREGFRQFRSTRWAGRFRQALPPAIMLDPLDAVIAGSGKGLGAALRLRRERYSGLYAEPGEKAWWVGRQAHFTVDRFRGTRVRLRGFHMGGLHQRLHGLRDLKMAVGIDDEPRYTVLIPPGPFDVSVDLEHLPRTWPVTLNLVPETSFVPSELGLNSDHRRLSVQIARIDIGDTTVFNASHEKAARLTETPSVPGLNVIGYARSEHGVGQSLRQFVAALDAVGIPSAVMDFNNNNLSRVEDFSIEKRIVTEPEYGTNVFHINADQMPEAEMHLPSHLFFRYNVGFWHWELPEMLDEHLAGFNRLDEIWVPTAFVQDAVAKKSPVPVVRMPHAIHFTLSAGATRAAFGLPDGKFLFLMIYDFSSYQERKNPQAALLAFERAFPRGSDNVALVIKTQNGQFHESDVRALRARLSGRENVIWINETYTRQQIYDLQSVCDALVSLHRSEGFGLGPAEAMFLGKPVIATNWSGNTEFMRPQNSLLVNYRLVTIEKDIGVYRAGQTWAEPDVDHAALLMRQIVEDEALRARISTEARRTMREEFSPEAIGQRIRARLTFIQNRVLAGRPDGIGANGQGESEEEAPEKALQPGTVSV